jgi:NADPH:quinone reductase-like Zn-dependent oxidoreductase
VLWNGGAFAEECVCAASQAIRLPSEGMRTHDVTGGSCVAEHNHSARLLMATALFNADAKGNSSNSWVLVNAEGIDVAAAAGLPVAFGTAHLALTERARLQAGQVLLVLGAGGGVGVAAVQVQGRAACAQCAASCIAADIPGRPYTRHLTACVLHVGRWAAADVTVSWHCMQIGKLLGAKVVAVARGPEKCALLSQLGADLVVDSVP